MRLMPDNTTHKATKPKKFVKKIPDMTLLYFKQVNSSETIYKQENHSYF